MAVNTFLYPRTLTFKRPNAPTTTLGALPYQGLTETGETILVSGIPANVEIASSGRNTGSEGLPGDSPGPVKWTITLPASVMSTLPAIQERDMIYDDLGRRFQIGAYQPTPLGAKIDTIRRLT